MTEAIRVTAPAKINVGLEILRKRPDGYHEIRSVMTALGLRDTISLRPNPGAMDTAVEGVPGVDLRHNLVYKAIQRFAETTGMQDSYTVVVQKRIPSPGGLGGASSDAATTLLALNSMHGHPLSPEQLLQMAASLGSDVPFFLGRSPALAMGTGTDLEPLRFVSGCAVLALPTLRLSSKTATLYGSLRMEDMSDGARAEAVAESLRRGILPEPSLLVNAFARALYDLAPGIRDLADGMIAAGAPYAALSGAGPAHYVLFERHEEAQHLASALQGRLGSGVRIAVAPPIRNHPTAP